MSVQRALSNGILGLRQASYARDGIGVISIYETNPVFRINVIQENNLKL